MILNEAEHPAMCEPVTSWGSSDRDVPDLGPNEDASFSRAIEITAAVLSLCGVAADNMTLVSFQMPFLSTGIMSRGSNALVAALHR